MANLSLARFSVAERRHVLVVTFLMLTRMLGMFMVLPVFTLCARDLSGATPAWVGLAMGIYGLVQFLCQWPLGVLSDRIGRRSVILMGLACLCLGGWLAAMAEHVFTLIIARMLQGMGAIGGVCLALIVDGTRSEVRARAMMYLGLGVGASFVVSLAVSHVLLAHIGFGGMWSLTAVLALLGMGLAGWYLPNTVGSDTTTWRDSMAMLWAAPRRVVYLGVGLQHALLASLFAMLPLFWQDRGVAEIEQQGGFYLLALLGSLLPTMWMNRWFDRHGAAWRIIRVAGLWMGCGLVCLLVSLDRTWMIVGALTIFFIGFNSLEAMLPAYLGRQMTVQRGAVMGGYSSMQFLGMFLGASVSPVLYAWVGLQVVLGCWLGCLVLWLWWSHD